jgi:hypothetical protein
MGALDEAVDGFGKLWKNAWDLPGPSFAFLLFLSPVAPCFPDVAGQPEKPFLPFSSPSPIPSILAA